MSEGESTPLISKSSDTSNFHKISEEELHERLGTSADGITSERAREKRLVSGLNYIKPPLAAPAW